MPGPQNPVLVVAVGFEEIVDRQRGAWCDACFLPSVVTITGVLTLDGSPFHVRSFLVCDECYGVADG